MTKDRGRFVKIDREIYVEEAGPPCATTTTITIGGFPPLMIVSLLEDGVSERIVTLILVRLPWCPHHLHAYRLTNNRFFDWLHNRLEAAQSRREARLNDRWC